MKKTGLILTAILVLGGAGSLWADSLYPQEGANSIYTEKRARRVGDVITVMITEVNQAVNQASSQNQKDANVAVGAGLGFFGSGYSSSIPTNNQIGVGAHAFHSGQGSSTRSSKVTGQMTAKITSVLPSGNYVIEGTRYMEVNEEKQLIEVTGEIRPDDIQSDNSIPSFRIANARVKFTGTGPASESAKPGILTRVLSWLGLF
jgi:flagellar L-ring protein precursor FlgH